VLLQGWSNKQDLSTKGITFPDIQFADDCVLYDGNMKKYIDGKSQMMNANFGHNVSQLVEVICDQASTLCYQPTMDSHMNSIAENYSKQLLSICPNYFKSVYCSLSGTSANEVAVQVISHYREVSKSSHKNKVLSITGCYHGCSTVMSEISENSYENKPYRVNDNEKYGKLIQPYCYRCPLELEFESCEKECCVQLQRQLDMYDPKTISMIILEPVQGAGVITYPNEYIDVLSNYAEAFDIFIVSDEVVTGMGRVGKDFGFELYDLKPNVITMSKTITNGMLPLGVTIFDNRLSEFISKNELMTGSTQDGNTLSCKLATAVLEHYRQFPWKNIVKEKGIYLFTRANEMLSDINSVGDLRCAGLLLCIELVNDKATKERYDDLARVKKSLLEQGVSLFYERNWITIIPPFTIGEDMILEILTKVKHVLERDSIEVKYNG